MSDNNYSNRTLRTLFPSLGTTTNNDFSDVLLEKALAATSPILGDAAPAVPVRVPYPTAADNGFFSVDGGGNLIITKDGLYSLQLTSGISMPAGFAKHYVQIDIGGLSYKFGTSTNASTGITSIPSGNCTIMNDSITIALKVGNIIEHYVAGSITGPAPGQTFNIIGTADSGIDYTRITLIYLSQA